MTTQTSPLAQVKAKAEAGDAAACYQVALAYKNGEGVAKNLSTAFQYMKSAAEKGYTPAYIEVAKMYHGGRGVTKDRDVAEQWYQKAADAGNAEARRILLNM
jgi:TPR repeat protein